MILLNNLITKRYAISFQGQEHWSVTVPKKENRNWNHSYRYRFPYIRTLDTMTHNITSTFGNNLVGKAMEAVLFTGCYVLWCLCNRFILTDVPLEKTLFSTKLSRNRFAGFWLDVRGVENPDYLEMSSYRLCKDFVTFSFPS